MRFFILKTKFYIFLIIFFTTPTTLVSSKGSISTLSKNLFTDSKKVHSSVFMIFLSLGKLALCNDEQRNIRKNYVNVAKAEYNWKENKAVGKDIHIQN